MAKREWFCQNSNLRNHDFMKTHDTSTAKYVKGNVVYANAPIQTEENKHNLWNVI